MAISFAFRSSTRRNRRAAAPQVAPDVVDHLQVLSVTDPLVIIFEVSFYAGIVITFPILLFYIAQFVLPALTPRERRIIAPAILVSFALFIVGVVFCYFFVLPQTLGFFFGFAKSLQWAPTWRVRDYFAFVTQITLSFGARVRVPHRVLLLVYMRVLTSGFLRRTRPFAIVIVLVLAALIAPTPDPITFLSLGLPMCLLYEACIWLGWLVERARLKQENKDKTLEDKK